MRQIFWLVTFLTVLPTWCMWAQKVSYTKRERNEVREGPGNYYPLIVVLRKGVEIPILETHDGWIKCYSSALRGRSDGAGPADWWISKNSLAEKPPGNSIRSLELELRTTKVTASAVMAAVRGFALRYGKVAPPTMDSLFAVTSRFTPQEYAQFQQSQRTGLRGRQMLVSGVDEQFFLSEYETTLAETGIGLGIIARIAGSGLIQDSAVVKYLNLLAAAVADVSGAYDIPFTVFVSKEREPKAYAVPGGFILISEGLLELCEDEAELAGILAHEIMHIVLRHGKKEQTARRNKIRMEEVFAELEEAMGEKPDSVVTELEEFALEAYETVVQPRLLSYEEEADRGAVVLLLRAGYDPAAVLSMIRKVHDVVRALPPRSLEDSPFKGLDFEKRYTALRQYLQNNVRMQGGARNPERFRQWVKSKS